MLGFEDAFLAEVYTEMAAEPDMVRHLAIRNKVAGYLHNSAPAGGVVVKSDFALVNPRSIPSWGMPKAISERSWHHPEFIKLAR